MRTILLTGGSGLVGKALCLQLQNLGYRVIIIGRHKHHLSGIAALTWDGVKNDEDKKMLESIDFVIHLAGANIGSKRWSKKRQQEIINSRTQTAALVYKILNSTNNKISGYISASAVGYYGMATSAHVYTEADPPGTDFLATTCRQWEKAAEAFMSNGIRTVILRTGVVLSQSGGVLKKLKQVVKIGIGSAIGSGKQYMPWIHLDDLCNIYIKAIEDEQMEGIFNAVAPEPIQNAVFIRKLAKHLKRPYFFPAVPAFVMKLIFGEMSGVVLKGSRVSSDKIQKTGFEFHYPNMDDALKNLLI